MTFMGKRADIMSAMKTRFQCISASVYQTNLGPHVYIWRTVPLDSTEVPALIIRDMSDAIVDYTSSINKMPSLHQLTVELEVVVADKTATIETVRNCLEDIEKAILVDETWGGKAMRTIELGNEIVANQEQDSIGGMTITLRIDFRTEKFKED
jgi:hypothetical protein